MQCFIYFVLIFTQITFVDAQSCEDTILDVSTLKTGQSKNYEWLHYPIVVFKGSFADSPDANAYEKHGIVPAWWQTKTYPLDLELMRSERRRIADNISEFWAPSPSYGCEVIYFPPYKAAREPGKTPYFAGKTWEGGYIDICYMHAFNTLGQLVAIDYSHQTKAPRIVMDLLIPPYKVMKNGDVKLMCNPNTSLKRNLANRSAA